MSENSGIPIINWFEDPIKQSINSIFKGVNESVEALDIFRKYRGAHFKSVMHSANHHKILGMNAPVKLVEIYYPAVVSTTIYRRLYALEELHSNEDLSSKSSNTSIESTNVRADKFVEDTSRVVVLGGPGSGKTTLLRYLAYAYCDKNVFKSSELQTSKFPVFIHLPDLAKCDSSLESFIGNELESLTDKYAHPFINRVLKNGSAVILLDSLDEVPNQRKSETIHRIKKFCTKFPRCSIVLSCRTADYEVILEDFYEVELTRLSWDAIEKIVKAWFGEDGQRAKKLLRHLKNDKVTATLMETPLLLSLLCIQYRNDLSIPTKRKVELFARCIVALLREWDASRNFRRDTVYENLSDDRKERIFDHVASHFFLSSPRYVFPQKELENVIGDYIKRFGIESRESKGILKEIESHHGILEKVSVNSFAFSHQSFHEFFTARSSISRRTDDKIIKDHLEDEKWSNVIEFIVALRENPDELIRYILSKSEVKHVKTYPALSRRIKNLWLLYRCLSTEPTLSPDLIEECYEHLVSAQVDMASVYDSGGVIPFAILMHDGVRHAYYYWQQRKTLPKVLQPLRQLANTIYAMPSRRYAYLAMQKAEKIENRNYRFLDDASTVLCLVIPLASLLPDEVRNVLSRLKQRAHESIQYDYLENMINESILNLQ